MTQYSDPSEVRAALEAHLGWEVPDYTWKHLVEAGYDSEVMDEESTIASLAKTVRTLFRATGARLPEHGRAGPMRSTGDSTSRGEQALPGDRQIAISEILAEEAASHPDVVAFRRELLGGSLLDYEEVEDWVKQHADADGAPTSFLTDVPLPAGNAPQMDRQGFFSTQPISISESSHRALGVNKRLLEYQTAASKWRLQIQVKHRGTLDLLRDVSEQLTKKYRWGLSQSTVFTLTGITPLVPIFTEGVDFAGDRPVLTRITFKIDPSFTPQQVAERYRNIRRDVLGGKRFRMQEQKALRLAAHAAVGSESDSWKDHMHNWNKEVEDSNPDWVYSDAKQFGRDCRLAWQKLMSPSYQLPFAEPKLDEQESDHE